MITIPKIFFYILCFCLGWTIGDILIALIQAIYDSIKE